MALELKRCTPLGRSKAGKDGRLRKGTTLSGKEKKKVGHNVCSDNINYEAHNIRQDCYAAGHDSRLAGLDFL